MESFIKALPWPDSGASYHAHPVCRSNRIPAHYHRAEVPKRDGGAGAQVLPDPVLNDIQRRIARAAALQACRAAPCHHAFTDTARGGGMPGGMWAAPSC